MMFITVGIPSSPRTGPTCRIAGCMRGANMNTIPALSYARRIASTSTSMLTPSASRTSALPDLEVNDRLPCLAIRTPAPAATSAAAVEMLNVPTDPPPVPHVSTMRSFCGRFSRSIARRSAFAAPAITSALSPRTRNPVSNAAICTCDASPRMTTSNAAVIASCVSGRSCASAAIAAWSGAGAGVVVMTYSYSGAGSLRYLVPLGQSSFELADEISLRAERRVLVVQLHVRPLQAIHGVHHLPFHRNESLLGSDRTALGGPDRVAQLVYDIARPRALRCAEPLDLALQASHRACVLGAHPRGYLVQRGDRFEARVTFVEPGVRQLEQGRQGRRTLEEPGRRPATRIVQRQRGCKGALEDDALEEKSEISHPGIDAEQAGVLRPLVSDVREPLACQHCVLHRWRQMIQREECVGWERTVGRAVRHQLLVDQRVAPRIDGEQHEAGAPVATGKLFVDQSERCRGVRGQSEISRERGKRFHGHPMLRVCVLNRDLSMLCVASAHRFLARRIA